MKTVCAPCFQHGSSCHNCELFGASCMYSKEKFSCPASWLQTVASLLALQVFSGNVAAIAGALSVAKVSGLIGMAAAMTSMFKPTWSQYTAPIYALCKGVALAGMSAILEMQYPGIAMNAVLLTFSTAASLFLALKTRFITITDRFADTVSGLQLIWSLVTRAVASSTVVLSSAHVAALSTSKQSHVSPECAALPCTGGC
eukprot:GHRR01032319.1.p1 GENE.GHRR01032319.1~~GHRR01032319.1.p1  ORF type:complete len:200 (-),score=47.84 GHRR01032319.1:1674-2273(-)